MVTIKKKKPINNSKEVGGKNTYPLWVEVYTNKATMDLASRLHQQLKIEETCDPEILYHSWIYSQMTPYPASEMYFMGPCTAMVNTMIFLPARK